MYKSYRSIKRQDVRSLVVRGLFSLFSIFGFRRYSSIFILMKVKMVKRVIEKVSVLGDILNCFSLVAWQMVVMDQVTSIFRKTFIALLFVTLFMDAFAYWFWVVVILFVKVFVEEEDKGNDVQLSFIKMFVDCWKFQLCILELNR